MLPDLPGLKRDIQMILDRYLQNQVHRRLGVFNEAPRHMMHEGNRMLVLRADGSSQESELRETSTEMTLMTADIPGLTIEERLSKLNDLAEQMAQKVAGHLLESLRKGLDEAGQIVNQKGKPFDADAVFEVLEKLQIDFDETGRHELTVLIPPALTSKAEEIARLFKTDRLLKKRYDEIMTRKREEWRDREAARKLVG